MRLGALDQSTRLEPRFSAIQLNSIRPLTLLGSPRIARLRRPMDRRACAARHFGHLFAPALGSSAPHLQITTGSISDSTITIIIETANETGKNSKWCQVVA